MIRRRFLLTSSIRPLSPSSSAAAAAFCCAARFCSDVSDQARPRKRRVVVRVVADEPQQQQQQQQQRGEEEESASQVTSPPTMMKPTDGRSPSSCSSQSLSFSDIAKLSDSALDKMWGQVATGARRTLQRVERETAQVIQTSEHADSANALSDAEREDLRVSGLCANVREGWALHSKSPPPPRDDEDGDGKYYSRRRDQQSRQKQFRSNSRQRSAPRGRGQSSTTQRKHEPRHWVEFAQEGGLQPHIEDYGAERRSLPAPPKAAVGMAVANAFAARKASTQSGFAASWQPAASSSSATTSSSLSAAAAAAGGSSEGWPQQVKTPPKATARYAFAPPSKPQRQQGSSWFGNPQQQQSKQPSSSFAPQQPQQHHHHQQQQQQQKPRRVDPLDRILENVVAGSSSPSLSSGAVRRGATMHDGTADPLKEEGGGGVWSVSQQQQARRFASTFRRIDAPRSASRGRRVVVAAASSPAASSSSQPAVATTQKKSQSSSAPSPQPVASRVAPAQRRERFDETACLCFVVERIVAGLSRESRVPVSQCLSFFFDSSSGFGGGQQQQQQQQQASELGLPEICDAFDSTTSRGLQQQVPAAVRAAVRARLLKRGGLLKFVEQTMQSKFEVTKDSVTSELVITPSAAALQEQQRLAQKQRQKQQHLHQKPALPQWAWNASGGGGGGGGSASPWQSEDKNQRSSSSSNSPWNQTAAHQRLTAEQLRYSERVPLAEPDVRAMMDLLAAGSKPVYGDPSDNPSTPSTASSWYYHVSLTGPRIMRSSEVADIFVDHVPTFWVKERHLARALMMAMPDVLGEMKLDIEQVFERYSPQVFELHWGEPKKEIDNKPFFVGDKQYHQQIQQQQQQKQQQQQHCMMMRNRDVRLSPFLVHPRRGAADAKWQLRAAEHVEEEVQGAQDRRFAAILLENLPHDGLFVHLPTWINKDLPPDDFAVINSAPPERVLTILHGQSSLFYIRPGSSSPPRLQCVTEHFDARQKQERVGGAAAATTTTTATTTSNNDTEEEEERKQQQLDIWIRRRPTHLAPRCIDEHDTGTSPAPELAQHLLTSLVEHEDMVLARLGSSTGNDTAAAAAKREDAVAGGDDGGGDAEQEVILPLPEFAEKLQAASSDGSESNDGNTTTTSSKNVNERSSAAEVRCTVTTVGHDSVTVWVPISHLYRLLAREQRAMVKPFATLAKFLRLHGRVFCVSEDLQKVSLHRWHEQSFATIETLLAEEDAMENVMPIRARTRKQLQHLSPNHPLLDPARLLQAIVAALPQDSSVTVKDVFMRLPQEARAALPTRNPYKVLLAAPQLLTVWKAHQAGKRVLMIQRAELGPAPPGCGINDCATREEIVAHLQELLSHVQRSSDDDDDDAAGGDGAMIPIGKLQELLRWDVVVGVRHHFGGLEAAIKAYPRLFVAERPEEDSQCIVALRR